MASHSQYIVSRISTRGGFHVMKCDEDFNFIETYAVVNEKGNWYCSCPNTMAPQCRHVKMLDVFKKKRAIGKGIFYCYDTGEWTKITEVSYHKLRS